MPDSPWFKMSGDDVRETWLRYVQQLFPDLRRESVRHFLVHGEQHVEPIHPLYGMHLIPSIETPQSFNVGGSGEVMAADASTKFLSADMDRAVVIGVFEICGARD